MPGGSGGLTLPTSTSTSLPCADADAFVTALRVAPETQGLVWQSHDELVCEALESDLQSGFDWLEGNRQVGKIVVTTGRSE